MNGPGSHQHRGLGMQGRYRAVVANGAPPGPHARTPVSSHPRNGWHPHNQHQQHSQQFNGNKEYPYRQCPPRYHNGYITNQRLCTTTTTTTLFATITITINTAIALLLVCAFSLLHSHIRTRYNVRVCMFIVTTRCVSETQARDDT